MGCAHSGQGSEWASQILPHTLPIMYLWTLLCAGVMLEQKRPSPNGFHKVGRIALSKMSVWTEAWNQRSVGDLWTSVFGDSALWLYMGFPFVAYMPPLIKVSTSLFTDYGSQHIWSCSLHLWIAVSVRLPVTQLDTLTHVPPDNSQKLNYCLLIFDSRPATHTFSGATPNPLGHRHKYKTLWIIRCLLWLASVAW